MSLMTMQIETGPCNQCLSQQ